MFGATRLDHVPRDGCANAMIAFGDPEKLF